MRAVTVTVLAALLAGAGFAAAHGGETHGYEQVKLVDGLFLTLRIDEPLIMAGVPVNVQLDAFRSKTPEDSGVEDMRLTLTGPDSEEVPAEVEKSGTMWIANPTFATEGTWNANLTVLPSNASVEYTIPVYADNPYVWTSLGAGSATGDVFFVNHTATMQLVVTEWRTGQRAPAPNDATARVEHWSDDHTTKFSEWDEPLEPKGPGLYELSTTLPAKGMYHVTLASPTLELEHDDRPYVHAYAILPEDAETYGLEPPASNDPSDVPGFAVGAALAVLGAVALAAARRRAR